MRISDEHLEAWRRDGYTLVDGFLSRRELAACSGDLHRLFPAPEQYAQAPHLFDNYGNGGVAFHPPFLGDRLNLMAGHPDLVDFVERVLGTTDVILLRATLWGKYTSSWDFSQPLHADYMQDSLVYPSSAGAPEQVTLILYYRDVAVDLGPTYVVSNTQMADTSFVPYLRQRHQHPELYELERPVLARAGSLLLYGPRTIHRASRLMRPGGLRIDHHIAYRRGDANWLGSTTWSDYGLSTEMQEMLELATPCQRALFGVPPPGHPYWNEETIRGMARRYPRMDLGSYLAAAGVSDVCVQEARGRPDGASATALAPDTGVASSWDALREQIRAVRRYVPVAAAYWEALVNYYETVAARSRAAGRGPAPAAMRPGDEPKP
jgi:hypothetical protein